MTDAGPGSLQLGQRITSNDTVEIRVAQRPDRRVIRRDEQLRAPIPAVDDRRQRDRSFGADAVA